MAFLPLFFVSGLEILQRAVVGQGEEPSDPKPVDHAGGPRTPGKFPGFHGHATSFSEKAKSPLKIFPALKEMTQLHRITHRVGAILEGLHYRKGRPSF